MLRNYQNEKTSEEESLKISHVKDGIAYGYFKQMEKTSTISTQHELM